jgi:uncharacterized protein YunC (DUF1805 family)
MFKHKRIKVGAKYIEAFWIRLLTKNLILLKGSRGYIMCGYLNLRAAQKAGDIAAKITGVATLEEALRAKIHSCTSQAKKAGIDAGRSVKDALKLIA